MKFFAKKLIYAVLILFLSCTLVAQAAVGTDDDRTTLLIRQALQEDLHLDPSNIKVEMQDGIVTLSGEVRTLSGKQYAILEAQKIAGVRGVIDTLQVVPSNLFDADIAQDVRRRLSNSASLTSLSTSGLGVTVDDGEVTLSGRVNSYAESEEAALLASEVRGVSKVKNHLTVKYPTTRPDAEIQQDVAKTLSHDVYLAGLPIRYTVSKGVVTLEGRVGSVYEKQRVGKAVRLVWNVVYVDNQLTVVPGLQRGVREQDARLTDAQVEALVRAIFAADQRLSPAEITLHSQEGEVTLLGTVPSCYQLRVAEQDARHVMGVSQVINQLLVRTVPRADAALQDDVQFQLNTDAVLGSDAIAARVHNGMVTLTGVVPHNGTREHAAEVTCHVIGVRRVVNQITVNWGYEDMALQRRIERRLLANAETHWVANKIRVTVDQGLVTLRGHVNLWSEREGAGDEAFHTYGVRSVNNQLVVVSSESAAK